MNESDFSHGTPLNRTRSRFTAWDRVGPDHPSGEEADLFHPEIPAFRKGRAAWLIVGSRPDAGILEPTGTPHDLNNRESIRLKTAP